MCHCIQLILYSVKICFRIADTDYFFLKVCFRIDDALILLKFASELITPIILLKFASELIAHQSVLKEWLCCFRFIRFFTLSRKFIVDWIAQIVTLRMHWLIALFWRFSKHWFLAVVCFPGLDGPVRISDGKRISPIATTKRTSFKPKTPKTRKEVSPTFYI